MKTARVTLALCLTLALASGASAALIDGLVGYWGFNTDAGGVAVDVLGAHNGTIYGDVSLLASGKVGSAFDFGGTNSHVEVGSIGISGAAPRTIAGWVKADVTNPPDWVGIFGFYLTAGGNDRYFDIECINNDDLGVHVYGWQTKLMDLNTSWNFAVATYDGTTIKWSLNGANLSTGTNRALNTVDNFRFGWREDQNPDRHFNGKIDDVGVWNRVLTNAEIAQLYNAGAGYWFFGSATSAAAGFWDQAATWTGSPAPPDGTTHVTIDTEAVTARTGYTNEGYSLDLQAAGSLTVGPGATLTIRERADVSGTLDVQSTGLLDASVLDLKAGSSVTIGGSLQTDALTVSQTPTIGAGASVSAAYALTLNAALNMTGATLTVNTATVTLNSGTLTCDQNLGVSNIVFNGGDLDLGGNTLTVGDTMTVSASTKLEPAQTLLAPIPTLTLAGGTLDYDPDLTVNVFNANGGDLDLGGYTLTVNNTFNLNASITLQSSETLLANLAIPTVNFNSGTLDYDGGSVRATTLNANGGTANLHGNSLVVDSTMNVAANTTFQSAQTLLDLQTATLNLNSGTLNYNATLNTNNVTANGGSLNMAGNTLNVQNNLTVQSGRTFDTTGPVNVGNAVVLNGTGRLLVSNDTVVVDGNVGGSSGTVELNGASAWLNFTGGGIYNNLGRLRFVNTGARTLDDPVVPAGSTVNTFEAAGGSTLTTGAGSAGRNFDVVGGTVNASHAINNANVTSGALNLAAGGDVTALDLSGGTVTTSGVVTIGSAYVHGTGQMTLGADANVTAGMTVTNSSVHAGTNRVTVAPGASLVCGDHVYTAQAGSFQASGDLTSAGADTIVLGGTGTVLAVAGPIGTNNAQGVWYGTLSGDINENARNPGYLTSTIDSDLSETENSIGGTTTEVYTGWFYDADGHISFTERIDDKARMWIDGDYISSDPVANHGTLIMRDDDWNQRSYSGTGSLPNRTASDADIATTPGWHSFELRISNGGGGSGPVGGEIGFGLDPTGGASYSHPSSGLAYLFTTDPNQVTFGPVVVNVLLTGSGAVQGNVEIPGTIAPGTSAGTIEVFGDLTLLPGSLYEVELGQEFVYDGLGYPALSDFLYVSGTATLEGQVNILPLGGFGFTGTGQVFDILYATDAIVLGGGFSLSSPYTGFSYEIVVGPGGEGSILRLTQVPEPSTLALVGLGVLAALRRARRKRR